MKIIEDFQLKTLNTFNIEAKTKYFAEFENLIELKEVLNGEIFLKEKYCILGGGSNILLTQDFGGLIIKNNIKGITILLENETSVIVEVGAGEIWHDFVLWSVRKNLSGIENLALIPGSVGASPIQNIGAYGMEVKNTISKVTAVEIKSNTIKTFTNSKCKFEYRNSVFKGMLKNKFIITKVEFILNKEPLNKTTYGEIEDELNSLNLEKNPKNISTAVINIRKRKLPDPKSLGNSGSFFKNPIIENTKYNKLKEDFPKIVGYKVSETKTKVAAAWLIDNAGFKGCRVGDAGVHKKQALVLVNYGNASGLEIIALAKKIQSSIRKKYNINIQPEVTIL